jgi:hypothetical protein
MAMERPYRLSWRRHLIITIVAVWLVDVPRAEMQTAPRGTPSDAVRLIGMAHSWLGGDARISKVTGLELHEAAVDGRSGSVERVLFPNRYQRELTVVPFRGTAPQRFVDTFDGRSAWRIPEALRFNTAIAPPDAGRSREAIARLAVMYFLRVVATYPMDVRRVALVCGIPGSCLEFRSRNDETTFYMVIDPATGQPRAFVRQSPIVRSSPPAFAWNITLLDDYRLVDGIRVPFRTTVRAQRPDGSVTESRARVFSSVRINPSFPAGTFAAPVSGADAQRTQ